MSKTVTFNNMTVSQSQDEEENTTITISSPFTGTSAVYISDETYSAYEEGILVQKHYKITIQFD